MSISSKQKHELTKFVKELQEYRGRHTELVTVYVPSGYDINKIVAHLSQEQGTASNIKSTSTRKNVQDALEKMIQHLRLYKMTPKNGLAAFSGNVAEREGQSDVKVWSIEPPVDLNLRLYRCDKQFVLEPLMDMMEVKEVFGLVVMDRRECSIAFLKGKTIVPLAHETSNVPGKTRAGGQSSARYMRLREDAAKDFYKKVAEMIKDNFFEVKDLKGIIVGGPGPSKYELVEKHDYITNELKKKIIGIKDISYTDNFGLQELVDKSEDLLANEAVVDEKRLMGRFFELLNTDADMVAYGKEHVWQSIEKGAADILLISESVDDKIIEDFETLCEQFGTNVEIISTETREGKQLHDMGQYGAILRYKLTY
ncbi:peptide chain release factor aRF-1 [Candidatus Woesearchaeota archaeon]|nr:peptide chain release factor aRF-1 [Candidatus Woesearchaeota archaeon]